MSKSFSSFYLHFAWFVAVTATLSSLYLSEIMHFPPCVLCWYQRIFLYPLVIILAVIILKKDTNMKSFVLPFSLIGMLFALFHALLQWGIIPDTITPCVQGISCLTEYFEYFGFINIPFLSFCSFFLITVAVLFAKNPYDKRS